MEKRMYCMFVHDGGDGKGGAFGASFRIFQDA